jgi:hypothetical protein
MFCSEYHDIQVIYMVKKSRNQCLNGYMHKKFYKKNMTETYRRTSPIRYQIFGLVRHKTIKCHLLNFRILMS